MPQLASVLLQPEGCAPSAWEHRSTPAPEHAAAPNGNITAGKRGHAARIQLMLGDLNPLGQRFGGVVIPHWNRLLADDRAGVHPRIHEMHRAASHFDALIQRLLPGFQAGKRRQERWMNVDDPDLTSFKYCTRG